jgi:hypothetical protein
MKVEEYEVYVDLDGVLADFDQATKDRFGMSMKTHKQGKVWSAIERYDREVKGWFYSLPKMPDADRLWEFVTRHFETVRILTATGTTPRDAAGQKKAWVGEKYGWDVECICVQSSSNKAEYAHEKAILIDDRTKSISPWINANGIGVLHKSAKKTIDELTNLMQEIDAA